MPQNLLPIYGETEMKTHNWVPGELVFKDNQEMVNKADQMMIGIKAIMDLLSKRYFLQLLFSILKIPIWCLYLTQHRNFYKLLYCYVVTNTS